MTPSASFAGVRALVTGGAGFVGSTLAIALTARGASVHVVDAMIPGYGGNLFNLEPVKDRVSAEITDIRDAEAMARAVRGVDVVFHLAGQMDHVLSLTVPFPDIDINIRGTTVLVVALKRHNSSRPARTRRSARSSTSAAESRRRSARSPRPSPPSPERTGSSPRSPPSARRRSPVTSTRTSRRSGGSLDGRRGRSSPRVSSRRSPTIA